LVLLPQQPEAPKCPATNVVNGVVAATAENVAEVTAGTVAEEIAGTEEEGKEHPANNHNSIL
jgi:hypothetical protein